jgi:hypothetical protein
MRGLARFAGPRLVDRRGRSPTPAMSRRDSPKRRIAKLQHYATAKSATNSLPLVSGLSSSAITTLPAATTVPINIGAA